MATVRMSEMGRKAAAEARAEVVAAMGTDRGYDGYFERTEVACPRCEAEGRKTNGGYTPRLSVSEQDRLVCTHEHGAI